MRAAGRRPGERARRDEVERRLAACGLAGRFPRAWRGEVAEPPIVRLRDALLDLGPVFVAFGRYLALRPDLLSETDCRILAALPDHHPPAALAALDALCRSEVGRPLAATFATFEEAPLASTLAYQDHRARLPGGEPVVVRLARPELAAELERDLGLLPLLAAALAAAGPGITWPAAAVGDDFAAAVGAAADLARQATALHALSGEAEGAGLELCVPLVVAPLSGRRMLTRGDLHGAGLAAFRPAEADPAPGLAAAAPRAGGEAVAVRLCRIWLRQAFFGGLFPIELRAADVQVLGDGRIAWTGGTLARLPAAAPADLWEYVLAAASHEPSRASAALIRHLDGGPQAERTEHAGEALDRRLRQLVPFRDGGWGAVDDLAGYLFLHWRCASELGYRARPHLVDLYRGLTALALEARQLAPGRDALQEGLEGVRLAAGLDDLARNLSGEQMRQLLGSYGAAMLAMPRRLDELLSLVAGGRASIRLEMVEPPAERRRKDSLSAATAALLAVAAVVLLAERLAAAGVLGPGGERLLAVLVGALGAWLLRGLGRRS